MRLNTPAKKESPLLEFSFMDSQKKIEIPDEIKKSILTLIGWNSIGKLGDILDGKIPPIENPDGSPAKPFFTMKPIRC